MKPSLYLCWRKDQAVKDYKVSLGTDFEQAAAERLNLQVVPGSPAQVIPQAQRT